MRKLILFLCLAIAVGQCFAQATTKMTRDSGLFRMKYSVLQSNPQIKEGKYSLSVIKSGKIITTGSYKNNKKDGLWDEYNIHDNVCAEGKFVNGVRTGVWSYYGKLWEVNDKFDFTKHELIYHNPPKSDSTNVYQVIKGRGDTINTIMGRPPVYLGGSDLMDRNLIYDLHYPPGALAANISGRVMISFTVDEHGHTRDYKVAQSVGHGLDQEALRVVKSIPDDWVGGMLGGKPVSTIIRLPVVFKTH